jgi:hypothetical protein
MRLRIYEVATIQMRVIDNADRNSYRENVHFGVTILCFFIYEHKMDLQGHRRPWIGTAATGAILGIFYTLSDTS